MDLWGRLERTALELLHTKGGALTINRTDRAQRNLLLTLERMVGAGTVVRALSDGAVTTYRLRE